MSLLSRPGSAPRSPDLTDRLAPRVVHAALLWSAVLASAAGLEAQRVRVGSSSPTGMVGGLLEQDVLFAAGDGTAGVELWRSNGTSAQRLVDVYPGPGSSYPEQIVRIGIRTGAFWFVAREKGFGRELHHYPRLQGTSTTRVLDIRAGALGSHPRELTLVGQTLFFTADDGIRGRELWASDGTVAGTRLVADLVQGAASSQPGELTAFQGRLVFAADVPGIGRELYVSDGTTAGTMLLADIDPGKTSSSPSGLVEFGGRVYFAARRPAEGRELWCTDGTRQGTTLVMDIEPGTGSSSPDQLTAGIALAFVAKQSRLGRQLFVMSPLGTPVRTSNLAQGETITQITPAGFQFWFRASTPTQGAELWRTSLSGSVELVHDVWSGAMSSYPTHIVPDGNNGVLFRADNGSSGQELWRTDGAKLSLVLDIRKGANHSNPSAPISFGLFPTTQVFAAKQSTLGVELHRFDGKTASLLADIDTDPPTPEMHLEGDDKFLSVSINDALPSKRAVLIAGLNSTTPTSFPFLRGALIIDLGRPNLPVFFSTTPAGTALLGFNLPPSGLGGNPIALQSFVETTTTSLDATTPSSCTNGENKKPTPNGAKARGVICLDDETGEYRISAERLDANATTAYIAVFRVTGEPSEHELIETFPLEAGDKVERDGRMDFKLRLIGDDASSEFLEIHILDSEPGPTDSTADSYVVASYC